MFEVLNQVNGYIGQERIFKTILTNLLKWTLKLNYGDISEALGITEDTLILLMKCWKFTFIQSISILY